MTGSARKISKRQLIALRGAKCEICGITEWCNKPLPFDDHHCDRNRKNGHESNRKIICPNCHRQQHLKHSEEAKAKMSATNSDGRRKGENHQLYGTHHSEETKQKQRIAKMGKHVPEETRRKISTTMSDGRMLGKNHPMYGKHLSEEHKAKISSSLIGRPFMTTK